MSASITTCGFCEVAACQDKPGVAFYFFSTRETVAWQLDIENGCCLLCCAHNTSAVNVLQSILLHMHGSGQVWFCLEHQVPKPCSKRAIACVFGHLSTADKKDLFVKTSNGTPMRTLLRRLQKFELGLGIHIGMSRITKHFVRLKRICLCHPFSRISCVKTRLLNYYPVCPLQFITWQSGFTLSNYRVIINMGSPTWKYKHTNEPRQPGSSTAWRLLRTISPSMKR